MRSLRLILVLMLAGPAFAGSPNILLLIADDYGVDSSPLYNTSGASVAPTPNLVALAQSGVLFKNAYVNPVCSPTRACLITGRHGFRTGIGQVIGSGTPTLSASEFTLPEAFAAHAERGYSLSAFGKWHLDTGAATPNTIGGWPHYAGNLNGGLASYTNWSKTIDGTTSTVTTYATTDVVNDTIAWIAAQGPTPWFAWVAFNAPHTPFHKPPNALHSYDALSGLQSDINAHPRSYYEAMTEALDTEIGRLLASVDRENTVIIFMGDNGTPPQVLQLPYTDRRSKSTIYEGGVHVPLVVSGPGVVSAGRSSDALVHAVDLYATILELVGINAATTVPAGTVLDSHSFVSVLTDTGAPNRYLYAECFGTSANTATAGRRIRDERYELLAFLDGHQAFYDLSTDPYESADLLLGTLTADQQSHYNALTLAFGGFQNVLAAPVLSTLARGTNRLTLTVPAETGVTYQLWRGLTPDDLASAPLTNAEIVIADGVVTLTDPAADADRYFYRIVATKP